MRLELSGYIEGDLDCIADYIALDNPHRSFTFIQNISAKFQDIKESPFIYQLRPDIGEEARISTIGNYAIMFRVMGDVVRIERVAYGGRNLSDIFGS